MYTMGKILFRFVFVALPEYSGLKYSNDFSDARQLAHLLRLGLLPTGYKVTQ
jgi:hypothetical protein